MSSVDDVHANASGVVPLLEEARQQATSASEKTTEAATGLESAKDGAEQLAQASNALGMETKANEADVVRAEAEALAARTAAVGQQLNDAAGELAAIKEENTQLLARIQALSG